jgi:hypothetical protein
MADDEFRADLVEALAAAEDIPVLAGQVFGENFHKFAIDVSGFHERPPEWHACIVNGEGREIFIHAGAAYKIEQRAGLPMEVESARHCMHDARVGVSIGQSGS